MRKITISLIIYIILLSICVGCGKNTVPISKIDDFTGYPVQNEQTLTYWVKLSNRVSDTAKSLSETEFAAQLHKETGVKVDFIHPPSGQEKNQFNLMLASDNMPDIIEYDWYEFPGGPQNAIHEGYILGLNSLVDKYSPNYKKYLEDNPEINKMVKVDKDEYFGYNFIRNSDILLTYNGPVIRKDWLDELGLAVPETIAEWHVMLTAFKEQKGVEAPLSFERKIFRNGEFVGAYGITQGFYLEDGVVKYGATQPAYKEFLSEFSKWYKEGLIDKNIANADAKVVETNILSEKSGATVAFAGSEMGKWLGTFNLTAAPHLSAVKGERAKFGQRDLKVAVSGIAAITTVCKTPELAARFLDYGYSEKGHLLYNFGIQDVSYTIEDGNPKYTDTIMKNPQGLSVSEAMARHARANQQGPFVQSENYLDQYYVLPEQKNAHRIWGDNDVKDYQLPRLIPSVEQSAELAKILAEADEYVDNMTVKFIMGIESIENFDSYVDTINRFNIGRAIEIYQDALTGYNTRN